MNLKRLIVSIIVLTLFLSVFDFIVHAVLLGNAYGETAETWRSEAEMMSRMWLQYVCYLVTMIGFVVLWALAFPGKGVKCGAIYGFIVGLMTSAGMLLNFVFLPIPDRFILPWLASGMIGTILLGILVALIYRPRAGATPAGG